MLINQIARISLLLLFALLQCVVPFAHAHVNGHNAAQAVHIDSVDSGWLAVHDLSAVQHDNTEISAEQHHSAVVCMPPEYRCSDLTIMQPVVAAEAKIVLLDEYVAFAPAAPALQRFPLPSYQHPCSQAPPA